MASLVPLCACFLLLLIALPASSLPQPTANKGPGFAFSGAGGRLPQLVALADTLCHGLCPGCKPIRPQYLSGASSGSIAAVILALIIESEETRRFNYTWDTAKQMLYTLKTSQVINTSPEGIARIPLNMAEGYFLDNSPEAAYFEQISKMFNSSLFGDLYVPTFISIVNQTSGETLRLYSRDPRYFNLNVAEIILASTAIPMAFKPRYITGFGKTPFVDGGTGDDMIPVYAHLNNPNVTEVFAISYSDALTAGAAELPRWLGYLPLLYNAMAVVKDMREEMAQSAIDMLSREAQLPAYQYIPALSVTFGDLDFDQGRLEYSLTLKWTAKNSPLRLNPGTDDKKISN